MLRDGTIATSEAWKRFRVDSRPTYLQDQVGQVVDRIRGTSDTGWRWVLRDIDFEAAPGEAWGLVGANGAGKSTLLKILTRVMYPTAGRIDVVGRVGAMIEVRAGLTPLLTGRENIYLTGILMGLKRKQIALRFDDIVEFAGLESAIDRQVKYYSSGMQIRLGFGVAAYLEPDVLLFSFCGYDLADTLRDLDRFQLPMRTAQMHALDSQFFCALTPKVVRGVEILAGLLNPTVWDAPSPLEVEQVLKR